MAAADETSEPDSAPSVFAFLIVDVSYGKAIVTAKYVKPCPLRLQRLGSTLLALYRGFSKSSAGCLRFSSDIVVTYVHGQRTLGAIIHTQKLCSTEAELRIRLAQEALERQYSEALTNIISKASSEAKRIVEGDTPQQQKAYDDAFFESTAPDLQQFVADVSPAVQSSTSLTAAWQQYLRSSPFISTTVLAAKQPLRLNGENGSAEQQDPEKHGFVQKALMSLWETILSCRKSHEPLPNVQVRIRMPSADTATPSTSLLLLQPLPLPATRLGGTDSLPCTATLSMDERLAEAVANVDAQSAEPPAAIAAVIEAGAPSFASTRSSGRLERVLTACERQWTSVFREHLRSRSVLPSIICTAFVLSVHRSSEGESDDGDIVLRSLAALDSFRRGVLECRGPPAPLDCAKAESGENSVGEYVTTHARDCSTTARETVGGVLTASSIVPQMPDAVRPANRKSLRQRMASFRVADSTQ